MADLTVEELTAQLAEANKKTASAVAENKDLITTRDGLKTKLAGIETAAEQTERERLEKQSEFEALYGTAQAQVTTLSGEKETLEEERTRLAAQIDVYTKRDEAELVTLLESVPEEFKTMVDDETLPLAKKIELARGLAKQPAPGPGARPSGEVPDATSIQARYAAALTSGDVMAQIALKNEMHQKD